MRIEHLRGHAEQRRLLFIGVRDDARLHVRGAARDVGQPRREQSAGTRLGGRDRVAAGLQQLADDFFHRAAVGAVDIFSDDGHQLVIRA